MDNIIVCSQWSTYNCLQHLDDVRIHFKNLLNKQFLYKGNISGRTKPDSYLDSCREHIIPW